VKVAILTALVVVFNLAGCPLGMSAHCGDEYMRNMTYLQSGWYQVVPTEVGPVDPLSEVRAIRIQKDPDAHVVVVETDDGRSARYRVMLAPGNDGKPH
jgi:hypothetical protein